MCWKNLSRDPLALRAFILLTLIVCAGLFAPWLAPFDPSATAVRARNLGISAEHWLGTDQLGRDIFSRLIFGVRSTLFYAFAAMLCTFTIGALVGVSAALLGGKWDRWLMRLCDSMLAFPSEVLVLALLGMLGPSLGNMLLAIVLSKWAWYARMLRAISWQVRERNYVKFAQVIGKSRWHILRRHLLPNIAAESAVLASADMSGVILLISALSFLGLGVQAPTAEWGAMLSEAKNQMLLYPEQMLPAGLAIVCVLICCNLLGDFLRDQLDPLYAKPNPKDTQ